jgi:hypothetical protein
VFLDALLESVGVRPYWLRLAVGAGLVSLLVSLGILFVLRLLGQASDNGLAGALAAVCAAAYAGRVLWLQQR